MAGRVKFERLSTNVTIKPLSIMRRVNMNSQTVLMFGGEVTLITIKLFFNFFTLFSSSRHFLSLEVGFWKGQKFGFVNIVRWE